MFLPSSGLAEQQGHREGKVRELVPGLCVGAVRLVSRALILPRALHHDLPGPESSPPGQLSPLSWSLLASSTPSYRPVNGFSQLQTLPGE